MFGGPRPLPRNPDPSLTLQAVGAVSGWSHGRKQHIGLKYVSCKIVYEMDVRYMIAIAAVVVDDVDRISTEQKGWR